MPAAHQRSISSVEMVLFDELKIKARLGTLLLSSAVAVVTSSFYDFARDQRGMFLLPSGLALPFVPASGGTVYVTSVQSVSITITAGTSNTATISPVSSRAFIVFQEFTSPNTSTTNPAINMAAIQLTNSTTVTASLNTSGTVTVKCQVIDPTSALVTSVQKGVITIASGSTSNTGTITAVTNANTAIVSTGFIVNTTSSFDYSTLDTTVSLAGTTVTATRGASGAFAVAIAYQVIEFTGSALAQSVQQITCNLSNNISITSTITSVNVNNAMVFNAGSSCTTGSQARVCRMRTALTSPTQLTTSVNTAGTGNISQVCVVEFASGVLIQSVQRGNIALAAQISNTATIISANVNKSICNFNMWNTSAANVNSAVGRWCLVQTSATVITLASNTAGTGNGYYEVGTFN